MESHRKTRKEVCNALGISYFTFSDWVNGKKYPRMDKVEMLAEYFGILKSDLIEEKITDEMQNKNDIATDIVIRLGADKDFCELVRPTRKDKEDMQNTPIDGQLSMEGL